MQIDNLQDLTVEKFLVNLYVILVKLASGGRFLEISMIQVKELRRSFGPVVAVDGISFEAKKGEVLGLLGPNGAGKTTAMRMLACFITPDSGTASICGHDILRNPVEVRRCLGYLAENSPA